MNDQDPVSAPQSIEMEADAFIGAVTCPHCGHTAVEPIPTTFCLFFYACQGCQRVLRPKPGDCCVFCSYGDRPCPSKADPLADG